ncbi:HD-GYP domain-containing protein [Clostridium oceanicum]|uniref:HD-GYP domain-containing protein n=1 Tax=Clostridium oceanicum TaxID=1543 RepID=A0ABP3UYQ4_9CLOT
MRLEFINNVKEDEVLGRSIFSEEGQVLLKAGMKLTNNYINKLKQIGVLYVYIQDERLEDVLVEDEKLNKLKQTTIRSMSNVMKNVHDFNGKKVKESFKEIEEIIGYIIDVGDVNKSLYDIKTYDNYTYIHSLDTCIMTTFMGMSCGFTENRIKEIGIGAILHDIGKIKVPSKIIKKKGRLTEEEFKEIKKHPIYGKRMLQKNIKITDTITKIVEQHHERVDGKGYPYGLKSSEISPMAKIVCVCDVYDAVSNDRCYRAKFKPNEAYELILSGSGSMFDKDMVQKFRHTFAIYPLGCHIRLSNNKEGYVVSQNAGYPDRPIIRIFNDFLDKDSKIYYELDLLKNPNITIEEIVR